MAWIFIRLKLTLIRNGLRRNTQRTIGFIIGASVAGFFGIAGFAVLAGVRNHHHTGTQLAVVGFTFLFVSWISLPIIGFGTDETLDPSRLALFPLPRGQMMSGLLAASVVGIGPLATLLGLCGALFGFVSNPIAFVIVVVAIALELALCLSGSRAIVTALSGLLRSRRGRDVSIVLAALVGLLPQSLRFIIPNVGQGQSVNFDPAVRALRWLPPGAVGHAVADARDGHYLIAVAELAIGAVVVAALLVWWAHALEKALTSVEATQTATARGKRARRADGTGALEPVLIPRVLRSIIPASRVGAVAARELRYIIRDPRRRVQLLYGFLIPLFVVVPLFLQRRRGKAARVLTVGMLHHPPAVLLALTLAFFLGGLTALNQFGVDGAAYWANVAAGNDPRADLIGKNLANVIVTLPAVTAVAIGLAIYSHGWLWLPITAALAVAMLGVELGVGNYVSVLAPQPVPDSMTNLWAQRSGQGCTAGLITLGAFIGEIILLLPLGAVAGFGVRSHLSLVVGVPLALVYAFALWRLGLWLAVKRVWWRQPELLEMLSPKQAA